MTAVDKTFVGIGHVADFAVVIGGNNKVGHLVAVVLNAAMDAVLILVGIAAIATEAGLSQADADVFDVTMAWAGRA